MSCTFQWSGASTSGSKKSKNDDSYIIFSAGIDGCETLADSGEFELCKRDIVFAVSDGMGGGNAGYLASSLILERISQLIPKTFSAAAKGFHPDYLEQLELQIEEIHHSINKSAAKDEAHKGMGATLTLAWFTPENLYLAHVGDSRLYLHRDSETKQLSDDHSYVWKKLKRGELNERQYRTHPRKSALYEAVGAGHRTVRPMIAAIPYQSGDQFMLCSDGIIDGLWEKHIHAAFLKNSDSTNQLATSLMSRAIENDGSDDTTLITLKIL